MLVYSNVRRTIEFPYKRRYGVRTQYSIRSSDLPLIERGAPTSAEDALLLYINHRVRRQRVRGSNAPRKKSVSPAGSTRTKRNLLRVTPTILLQRAGGTRSTFTSCGPHPPYTFTSCGLHPPYCCFVPAVPVARSCSALLQPTPAASITLTGCATNLNTAVSINLWCNSKWYGSNDASDECIGIEFRVLFAYSYVVSTSY